MTAVPDPYRVLGLPRGATLDEVKRAYRRLAKANHPDAAGATALPRFLAIQAAYEQIAGGPAAGARDRDGPAARRRPSAADADRTDATRRAYGGRARDSRAGGTRPGGTARPGGSARSGEGAAPDPHGPSRPGAARPAGPGGPSRTRPADPGTPPPSGGQPGTRATRGKATLGSTSYDGADAGPFEPDWGGASWYGTTSGTYWTINPKEYADPRKHGPEYQARARRTTAARGEAADGDRDDGTAEPARAPGHTTSSWWESTAGPVPDPPDEARDEDPVAASAVHGASEASQSPRDQPSRGWRPDPATAARPTSPAPDPATAAIDLGRALTDPRSGGLRGRVVRALIGWLPIALGLGWLIGELSGCGRFAATCDPAVGPLTAAGQGTLLAALVLLPEVAALAAGAALAALVTAVAASFVLSATGEATDAASRTALGVLLILAWLGGLTIGVVRRLRGTGQGPGAAGPVS
jgi:curved DNA-binding protein CbpA